MCLFHRTLNRQPTNVRNIPKKNQKKKGSKSGGVPSFLSWSWGQLRKVTLIPSPLKWPPQASLGAFPFTVWTNWRWGIHESTPQPRGKNTVKRNSKRESSRRSSKNQRLFLGVNLVLRLASVCKDRILVFEELECKNKPVRVHTCLYVRFRETGDWDIFPGPLEWVRAETGRTDQWVL